MIGSIRSCQWQGSGKHTFTIGIIDKRGIDDVRSQTQPQPMTVGTRRAVRYTAAGRVCAVALTVTATSRVDVSAIDSDGTVEDSCALADQVAPLVAAKLP